MFGSDNETFSIVRNKHKITIFAYCTYRSSQRRPKRKKNILKIKINFRNLVTPKRLLAITFHAFQELCCVVSNSRLKNWSKPRRCAKFALPLFFYIFTFHHILEGLFPSALCWTGITSLCHNGIHKTHYICRLLW